MSETRAIDRVRQVFVTVSLAACVLGTLVGVGVLGERVAESSGGALAADATLLAPAGTAFSIWSVVYLGLLAYTVWQWRPRAAAADRERAIGWLAGGTMILNAVWLLVTQAGLIWLSVLVILVLAVLLGLVVLRLGRHPASGWPDRVVVDGTFGLYLGWVTAASCANVAAAGSASGWVLGSTVGPLLACAIVLVAVAIGLVYARVLGARFAVAAALVWALAWIAVGRLADEPHSTVVGITAIAGIVILMVGTALIGRSRSSASTATI